MGVCFGVGEIVPKKIKELESKVAKLEEELKAYRDAEEQGLLLRLPCKVGDTVYWLTNFYGFNNNYSVTEEVVNEIQITEDDFVIVMSTAGVKYGRIGENVFPTKEEAEQKLAEMRKE